MQLYTFGERSFPNPLPGKRIQGWSALQTQPRTANKRPRVRCFNRRTRGTWKDKKYPHRFRCGYFSSNPNGLELQTLFEEFLEVDILHGFLRPDAGIHVTCFLTEEVGGHLVKEGAGAAADQNSYGGQERREIREVLARDKDFVKWIFKPEPTFLGDKIPISA